MGADRTFLALFTIILLARYIPHAWHPDGGLTVARQYFCSESRDAAVVIIFMYGNTQLGLLLHDLISLYDNHRVRLSNHIHGILSLIHVFVVNVAWDHIKAHPYPETPKEGLRPGGYLWYVEAVIYLLYLVYVFGFPKKDIAKKA